MNVLDLDTAPRQVTTYGLYLVTGHDTPTLTGPDAGLNAGEQFPVLTHGDLKEGQAVESFGGFWMNMPWRDYLDSAREVKPYLRVLCVELATTSLQRSARMPSLLLKLLHRGQHTFTGLELGWDALDDSVSLIHKHLFEHPSARLEKYRARLSERGFFASREDAKAYARDCESSDDTRPWSSGSKHRARVHKVYWVMHYDSHSEGATGPRTIMQP